MKNELNPLVKEVKEDFKRRQNQRKCLETQWQMNMNFYMGNQLCSIGYGGNIEDFEKQFFWQEREVFNHIAPIIEIRFAKLSKIRPKITVIPASDDESDLKTAKVAKKVLNSVANRISLSEKITEAMKWSEICGTSFYKISWDNDAGQVVAVSDDGVSIKSGDINVSVCSPFEIFPDNDTCEAIENCESIIHARVYGVDEVKSLYGVDAKGEDINVFAFDSINGLGGLGYNGAGAKIVESKKKNSVLVLEKYEKPTVDHPNGRLVIVAGDQLAYDGELPYENGIEGRRTFPFIKQESIKQPGCFWGTSIIERLIPVQRAYNAVKNRKHEYLNRISMGILKVEDGSVDVENLEEEGLCPGKILVFRQGSTPPAFLSEEEVPKSFSEEEESLLEEFKKISGVTEVMDTESVSKNLSGTALELMLGQDELRLNATADAIKASLKQVGKHVLRLYRQFAGLPRLTKIVGDNGKVELFYFSKSDISSDDIAFETETELGETLSQRRQMLFELLGSGLLTNEDGKISTRMKSKVLELLGFGIWEGAQDLSELQIKKAERENLALMKGEELKVSEIDDDELHINEHVAYMLTDDFAKCVKTEGDIENSFLLHIASHKQNLKNKNQE